MQHQPPPNEFPPLQIAINTLRLQKLDFIYSSLSHLPLLSFMRSGSRLALLANVQVANLRGQRLLFVVGFMSVQPFLIKRVLLGTSLSVTADEVQ